MNFSEGFSWLSFLLTIVRLGAILFLVVMVVGGMYYLVQGIVRRDWKKMVWGVVAPLAYIAALFFWIYSDMARKFGTVTEENVAPSKVQFLTLPETASGVGYWQDGNVWLAEYDLPEKDFVAVLPEAEFVEIVEPVKVQPKKFGDPQSVPYRDQMGRPYVLVTKGLIFKTHQANGGGFKVIYDRERGRGYFEFIARGDKEPEARPTP